MPKFDIAFSLNRQIDIEADNFEKAEEKLEAILKSEGIDVNSEDCTYTLEVFDVNESESEQP